MEEVKNRKLLSSFSVFRLDGSFHVSALVYGSLKLGPSSVGGIKPSIVLDCSSPLLLLSFKILFHFLILQPMGKYAASIIYYFYCTGSLHRSNFVSFLIT